jgi:hypothetical protein
MKKGQISGTMMIWIYRMILLVIVFFFIYIIININLARSVKINDIDANILETRLLYGPKCIAYNDGRVNPGILDVTKISEDQLNSCTSFKNQDIQGYNLTIFDESSNVVKNVTINHDIYDLNFACKIKSKIRCNNFKEYILYYDGNKIKNGVLFLNVVTRDE